MKIKAKIVFLTYDGTTPIIARKGAIIDVSEKLGKSLINAGMAESAEERNAMKKPNTRKAAKVEK